VCGHLLVLLERTGSDGPYQRRSFPWVPVCVRPFSHFCRSAGLAVESGVRFFLVRSLRPALPRIQDLASTFSSCALGSGDLPVRDGDLPRARFISI